MRLDMTGIERLMLDNDDNDDIEPLLRVYRERWRSLAPFTQDDLAWLAVFDAADCGMEDS